MYSIWILQRLEGEPLPLKATSLPKHGRILEKGLKLCDTTGLREVQVNAAGEECLPLEEALAAATEFNEAELEHPIGLWAVVTKDDLELTSGKLVSVCDVCELN